MSIAIPPSPPPAALSAAARLAAVARRAAEEEKRLAEVKRREDAPARAAFAASLAVVRAGVERTVDRPGRQLDLRV